MTSMMSTVGVGENNNPNEQMLSDDLTYVQEKVLPAFMAFLSDLASKQQHSFKLSEVKENLKIFHEKYLKLACEELKRSSVVEETTGRNPSFNLLDPVALLPKEEEKEEVQKPVKRKPETCESVQKKAKVVREDASSPLKKTHSDSAASQTNTASYFNNKAVEKLLQQHEEEILYRAEVRNLAASLPQDEPGRQGKEEHESRVVALMGGEAEEFTYQAFVEKAAQDLSLTKEDVEAVMSDLAAGNKIMIAGDDVYKI